MEKNISTIVGIACAVLGEDGLRLNEHKEFVKFNETNKEDDRYGELHVGVDEYAGFYQILDPRGRGLMEFRFFEEV